MKMNALISGLALGFALLTGCTDKKQSDQKTYSKVDEEYYKRGTINTDFQAGEIMRIDTTFGFGDEIKVIEKSYYCGKKNGKDIAIQVLSTPKTEDVFTEEAFFVVGRLQQRRIRNEAGKVVKEPDVEKFLDGLPDGRTSALFSSLMLDQETEKDITIAFRYSAAKIIIDKKAVHPEALKFLKKSNQKTTMISI